MPTEALQRCGTGGDGGEPAIDLHRRLQVAALLAGNGLEDPLGDGDERRLVGHHQQRNVHRFGGGPQLLRAFLVRQTVAQSQRDARHPGGSASC